MNIHKTDSQAANICIVLQCTVQPAKSYYCLHSCTNMKRIKLRTQPSQNPRYFHDKSMLISRWSMKLSRVTGSFHATRKTSRSSTLVSQFYSPRIVLIKLPIIGARWLSFIIKYVEVKWVNSTHRCAASNLLSFSKLASITVPGFFYII